METGCTHFRAGSRFACAILIPCTSSQTVLYTHFRAGSRFACASLNPCTSSQIVPCTHFRAGSRLACASLKHYSLSQIALCTHFRAGSRFVRARLRPCTSPQIVLCTHFGASSRFVCARLKPCTSSQIVLRHFLGCLGHSSWLYVIGYCSQSVLGRTHSLEVLRRNTLLEALPGFPWVLLSRVSSVAHTFLEVRPSQTLSWSLSLDFIVVLLWS